MLPSGPMYRLVQNSVPPPKLGVSLDDAHGDEGLGLPGDFAESRRSVTGDDDALVPVALEQPPAGIAATSHDGSEAQTAGISGDERFGEENHPSALACGFPHQGAGFVHGGLAVEQYRRGLYDRGFDRGRRHVWSLSFVSLKAFALCGGRNPGS